MIPVAGIRDELALEGNVADGGPTWRILTRFLRTNAPSSPSDYNRQMRRSNAMKPGSAGTSTMNRYPDAGSWARLSITRIN